MTGMGRRPVVLRAETTAWLIHRPVLVSLLALAAACGLLEAKNATILEGADRAAVDVWTFLTVNHASQGLAMATGAVLAAFVAATRRTYGLDLLRRAAGGAPGELLLDLLTIAATLGAACFAMRLVGSVAGIQISARLADLQPPLVSAQGYVGMRLFVGDALAVTLAAMLGALFGAAARSVQTALAGVAPVAVLALDQLSVLLVRFPRLSSASGWLPAGLLATSLEGSADRSARAILPPDGTRSPWLGVAGLALWFAVGALALLRRQPLGDRSRLSTSFERVAPVLAAATVIGLVMPPLFGSQVPWRYRTDWLAARAEHRSSLDVVANFVTGVRAADPGVRDLLVSARGADPLTDPFFAPIRGGSVERVGPDSRMSGPETVPVEIEEGGVRVIYLFQMQHHVDTWRIAAIQILQGGSET